MQDRHLDRQRYFNEQAYTTEKYVIPFMAPYLEITAQHRVLEVGCGEGGNLMPFLNRGCECVGVDLSAPQIARAREFFVAHPYQPQLQLLASDIYLLSPAGIGTFDFIFLRDVIEHIVDQDRFLAYIKQYLRPGGRLFLGFPPWQMPFGGHQQICTSKLLSKLPYFHLLPRALYRGLLQAFGESPGTIQELLYIKKTGISIERLRRLLRKNDFRTDREQLWLVNPNYEVKFGWPPRPQWDWLAAIPFLRNFVTSCGYYVVHVAQP